MTGTPRKGCMFCGATNDLTNEHVIPRWLLRELEKLNAPLMARHSFLTVTLSERRQVFNSLVYGVVCRTCNNGWMSGLEGEVMPYVKILLRVRSLGFLSLLQLEEGARPLSLWTLKTAGMMNAAANYRKILPEGHVRGVKKGIIPPCTYFSAGFASSSALTWRQSEQFFWESSPEANLPSVRYKVSFQFGHLLLQVAHLEGARQEDSTFRSTLLCPKFRAGVVNHSYSDLDEFDVEGGFVLP